MGTSFWGVEKRVLNPASCGTISWVIVTPPPSFGIHILATTKKVQVNGLMTTNSLGINRVAKNGPRYVQGFCEWPNKWGKWLSFTFSLLEEPFLTDLFHPEK